jgi:hypothetical protein
MEYNGMFGTDSTFHHKALISLACTRTGTIFTNKLLIKDLYLSTFMALYDYTRYNYENVGIYTNWSEISATPRTGLCRNKAAEIKRRRHRPSRTEPNGERASDISHPVFLRGM